ncbi:CAMK/CAMKL protein kinase [Sphaeroforma arctica JP610]|uniref:CAMK/CAMKL protein kinase n=1 Tax=Sphaeroforma arctica JP610 TaxID=667725 RepID=A0A0L0FEB3_9EUKA|nr:CAMK/CAMKL protein kinase [Sphaeroforma arctica JP610]KNC75075.1 CAMK/CAMKL protein kinase [Sphaeroforma arctica JP610]|eukprot:XP_014148977.1 CAMK/CAMKL protein kinase [Sphaeroforma arctica JP610]
MYLILIQPDIKNFSQNTKYRISISRRPAYFFFLNSNRSKMIETKSMEQFAFTRPIHTLPESFPVQTAKNRMTSMKDFKIEYELGRGSYAVVYAARHRATGLTVAIKAIDKRTSESERVSAEVMAMSLCTGHPVVVRLYNAFEDDDFVYLVMEMVAGITLHDYIKRNGRIGAPQARRWFRQLLSAIAYCTERGVVHRDIKNANIMIDEDTMQMKLVDFGMAVVINDAETDLIHLPSGSPVFAAPEIYFVSRGEGYKAQPAELWSAGVVLHSMLNASLPYDIETYTSTWSTYLPPRYASSEAKHLLTRMFPFRIRDRYTFTQVLEHPWMTVDEDQPLFSASLGVFGMISPRGNAFVEADSNTSLFFEDNEGLIDIQLDSKNTVKSRHHMGGLKYIASNLKSKAARSFSLSQKNVAPTLSRSCIRADSPKSEPLSTINRSASPLQRLRSKNQAALHAASFTDPAALQYTVQFMARAGFSIPDIKDTIDRRGSGHAFAGRTESDLAFDLILDSRIRAASLLQVDSIAAMNKLSKLRSPHNYSFADLNMVSE